MNYFLATTIFRSRLVFRKELLTLLSPKKQKFNFSAGNISIRSAVNMADDKKIKLEIKNPILWLDMEMTGLNINKDKIMEVACLLTDGDLNIIEEGPELVLHQSDDVLDNMNEWCVAQHGKSGLTQLCRESKFTEADAEEQILAFLKKYVEKGVCVVGGNTVHQDKKFLAEFLPQTHEYLHYRLIDVSTLKELCRSWYPDIFENAPKKSFKHRGMEDIKDSIEELKYYKSTIFIPQK